MFSRTSKTEAAPQTTTASRKSPPSVISSELHILGNLLSEGHIDIDGTIEGNIKAEQITVRPNGKVSGDLIAQSVHVQGEVHGLIRAHAVHLYSSARVEGVIMHQSLIVEDGAFLDAKFKRMQDKALLTDAGNTPALADEDEEGSNMEPSPIAGLRLIG